MTANSPEVSVVMAVYNAGTYLGDSLDGVLSQQGVSLELIVVDDGSTDDSPRVLEACATKDARVRVIRQANEGLTQALIRGCGEARGAFIARQDADDLSLPGRLRLQVDRFAEGPPLALVGCWTRYIGPCGEDLGTWEPPRDPVEARRSLRCRDIPRHRGLGAHGSAMFRRADYVRVGGYRGQFYFAQDLDLWLRLTDSGALGIVPRVLYAWRMTPHSITGRFRDAQVASARLALELASVRDRGQDETPLLHDASVIRPGVGAAAHATDEAAGLYFIGKRLLDRGDPLCVPYLRQALRKRPSHFRAWCALAIALIRRAWAAAAPGRTTE